ncbi:Glycerate 3-kinase [bioreactor metagenome]|uniref:Glycerate 3-kinase n=1 Tax=bioreactor metagenome TaxID=1076179 RepID=A0A645BRT5_9ZZZZ|nr:glycerate kinase [Oscillospiraceae bacterium]
MKKIVIAIASFKGSATSMIASLAACRGVLEVYPEAKVVCVPIADGGEGTVDAFVTAYEGGNAKGEYVRKDVTGPEFTPVTAKYYILADKTTAIIELAQASGLYLSKNRIVGQATTLGTGELIADAVNHGCKKIILGLGGSATNDGGIGALTAMGIRFTDKNGAQVRPCGDSLSEITDIDTSHVSEKIRQCEIVLACDVTNTLCGYNGASFVYGPQKGATPEDVKRLDNNLAQFARLIESVTGRDVMTRQSGGAAGGIAAGLMGFFDVKVSSGIKLLLDHAGFDKMINGADFIITGEGRFDDQSVNGKAVCGICDYARNARVPVIVVAGELATGYTRAAEKLGITAAFSVSHAAKPFSEVIDQTADNINDTVMNICTVMKKFSK